MTYVVTGGGHVGTPFDFSCHSESLENYSEWFAKNKFSCYSESIVNIACIEFKINFCKQIPFL